MILSFSKTVKKVKKTIRVVKGGSRLEITSAGFKDGNYASVKVNNDYALSKEQARRGINVVVLDGFTHKIIAVNSYDTYGNPKASDDLVADF